MSARKRSGVYPDVQLSRWFADFPDPDTFFSSLFYSKTEDVLDVGYRNAEVDRLVEKGARLLDAAEREAVYRDAEPARPGRGTGRLPLPQPRASSSRRRASGESRRTSCRLPSAGTTSGSSRRAGRRRRQPKTKADGPGRPEGRAGPRTNRSCRD